jgi:methyltransferase (TIGR00027 family)
VTSTGQSSQTALTAAAARAAHLIVDSAPAIFADTLAEKLLGDQAEELLGYHRAHGGHIVLSSARTQVLCRSRYTEDRLAESVRRGVRQYVILGAGLDTFAYRSNPADQVRVFEVDHPATQQWKRQRLSAAKVPVPEGVAYISVDFEADSLVDRLVDGGFDLSRPAFVSWLGVTMYLTHAAIAETLAAVGRFASGTEIIVDYMVPENLRDTNGRTYVELVMPVAAQSGEPWLTFLTPHEVSALLTGQGFERIAHVRQRDMLDAALWDRSDSLQPVDLSSIAHAYVRALDE